MLRKLKHQKFGALIFEDAEVSKLRSSNVEVFEANQQLYNKDKKVTGINSNSLHFFYHFLILRSGSTNVRLITNVRFKSLYLFLIRFKLLFIFF